MGIWEKLRDKDWKPKEKKKKRPAFWWENQEAYGKTTRDEKGHLTGWDGGNSGTPFDDIPDAVDPRFAADEYDTYYGNNAYYGSQHYQPYTYTPLAIKQSYDMSVSLETRITQLIQTITGQRRQLVQSSGWGMDSKYLYFNPDDINENASDDEVLGRILHQLGVAQFRQEKKLGLEVEKDTQKPYKHLLTALDQWRNDRQLWDIYPGCKYYARAFWAESAKEQLKPLEEDRGDEDKYGAPILSPASPTQQFLYAVHAIANEDDEVLIKDPEVEVNFAKAVTHIEDYLLSADLEEALTHFEEIKKYYPVPDQDEQNSMDQKSNMNSGISKADKESAKREARKQGKLASQDALKDEGKEGGFSDTEIDPRNSDSRVYWNVRQQYEGTINTLHKLLQSIITDNEAKKYTRPYKRGKLDKKRIYKFVTTGNMRVFKQPREINQKRYGMMILVDQSSSMSGSNANYSMEATIVLTEVFNRLSLPFSIMGFSDNTYNYKRFNQSIPRSKLVNLRTTYGGTNDVLGLKKVDQELETAFRNQRTGVFVITDGCGASQSSMRAAISTIEEKNAKVFGIGIGSVRQEQIDRSYSKGIAVTDVRQLPRELATLMKSQFRRT